MTIDPDRLIAHRGWRSCYPENSLAGFDAAVAAGARNIEFDVQLTRDLVPIVLHDETSKRVGGDLRSVFDIDASDAVEIANGEPQRFGYRFNSSRIPTLAAVIEHLAAFEGRFFVELKRQSIAQFGARQCLDAMRSSMRELGPRGVLISFDADAVGQARDMGIGSIGWVIKRWTSAVQSQTSEMQPDYLFVKKRRLRAIPDPFPQSYSWVVHDVDNGEEATDLFERGACLIETDYIGEFLLGRETDEA